MYARTQRVVKIQFVCQCSKSGIPTAGSKSGRIIACPY
jgi:hypothetical protein